MDLSSPAWALVTPVIVTVLACAVVATYAIRRVPSRHLPEVIRALAELFRRPRGPKGPL